jgi:hypothetical protein
MAKDALGGETVLWAGGPSEVQTPSLFEAVAWVSLGLAIVALAFGCARCLGLGQSPAELLLFAGWAVTVGCAARIVPNWWAAGACYTVTERLVIWQRGPFRRSIERHAISYARITWSARLADVGTLELVRAVPTGALGRCLALRLEGLRSPDGVLAIIRGAEAVACRGHGTLPIAQRLDYDERVLWAARPLPSLRAYVPRNAGQWLLLAITAGLGLLSVALVLRAYVLANRVVHAGLSPRSAVFLALTIGMGVAVTVVLGTALFLLYSTVLRRARTLRTTRYVISNKRVLIQRGREELHLERNRIVDVIDAPTGDGTSNLFLVVDGPRARAVATGGAFGESEQGPDLRPVFECVHDSDGAQRVLRIGVDSPPPLHHHAA